MREGRRPVVAEGLINEWYRLVFPWIRRVIVCRTRDGHDAKEGSRELRRVEAMVGNMTRLWPLIPA